MNTMQPGHYYTRNGLIAHVARVEDDGRLWGSIEDHGLMVWEPDGKAPSHPDLHLVAPTVKRSRARVRGKLKAPAMQRYPGQMARWGVSPAMWWDRVGYTGPLSLVMHATAGGGSASWTYDYFMDPSVLKCSHFIVGETYGDLYQCGDIHWAAAANGNCSSPSGYWPRNINGNFETVSIEVYKRDTQNASAPTNDQYKMLGELVPWICAHAPINMFGVKDASGGITTHGFFDPQNRSNVNGPGGDPGTFDWNRFYQSFQPVQPGGVIVFSDALCIAIWESHFRAHNLPIPPRDLGIFNAWRKKWRDGHYLGCPIGPEFDVTLPNDHAGRAQNFTGGTCAWDLIDGGATWL